MISSGELDHLGVDRTLDGDAICVWTVDLDWPESRMNGALKLLSLDEQKRAARFHRETDGRRFIVAHAALRLILARYLETDANEIVFECNAYGKSRLRNNDRDIRFNLAHSHNRALCALAVGQEVGVDLEFIRPAVPTLDIAQTFFAPEEITTLSALAGDDFVRAFYRCWTRKEAYVKATGLGLSLALDSFVVSIAAAETPLLLSEQNQLRERPRWRLLDVKMGNDFVAALAVQATGKMPRILRLEYQPGEANARFSLAELRGT